MPHKTYRILFITALITLLSACGQAAEDPRSVADRYWQNLQTGNDIEAEKLISINSRQAFATHSEAIDSNTQIYNDDISNNQAETSFGSFEIVGDSIFLSSGQKGIISVTENTLFPEEIFKI